MKNSFFAVSPLFWVGDGVDNFWKPLSPYRGLGQCYIKVRAALWTTLCHMLIQVRLCLWVCYWRSCCGIHDLHVLSVNGIEGLVPMNHGTKHQRLWKRQVTKFLARAFTLENLGHQYWVSPGWPDLKSRKIVLSPFKCDN